MQGLKKGLGEILFSEKDLSQGVARVAEEIVEDYMPFENQGITLVPILTGSIIFVADLIRALPLQMHIAPMSARSYVGESMASNRKPVLSAVAEDLKDRHVLLVEDIFDSGNTLRAVRSEIEKSLPASIKTCVLLRKRRQEAHKLPCEYVVFEIPDLFVVGYGLDYDGLWRNCPEIYSLKY